jgi:hypothetical protein
LTGKYLLAMIGTFIPSITQPTYSKQKSRIDMTKPDIDLQQSGGKRGTVLHALLQDFTPSGATQNGTSVLTTKATGPSSYFGPAPPAETPKHPHNYVFLLHAQPEGFAVPAAHKQVVQSRMNIDWVKFMADAGLSAPVAGNYLQVQSGDNTRR